VSRQVLTIPDVPPTLLQSATAAATYVPLAGGNVMTGSLGPTATNGIDLGSLSLRWRSAYLGTVLSIAGASATANQITHGITTDAQPRLIVDGNGQMKWGPGATTPYDTTLARTGVAVLGLTGSLNPGANNAYDLGTWDGPLRWRTLYTVNAEASSDIVAQHLISQGADAGFFLKDRNTANQYIFTSVGDQLNWYSSVAGVNQFVMKGGNAAIGLTTPPALHPARRALFVGDAAMLMSGAGYNATELRVNSYQDSANVSRAMATNAAGSLALTNNSLNYANAPSVGAGAIQAFVSRLFVSATGATSLIPDDKTSGLVVGSATPIAAWASATQAIQIGARTTLYDIQGYSQFGNNTYNDTGADRAIVGGVMGSKLYQQGGALVWLNAAIVAANASQSMVEHFRVDANGTMSVTCSSTSVNTGAFSWPGGNLSIGPGSPTVGDGRIITAYNIQLNPGGGVVQPGWDAGVYLGSTGLRYVYAYIVNGVITGSHVSLKENLSPLDPAACVEAVLGTDWMTYSYREPAPPPSQGGATEEYLQAVAENEPNRHRKGYVLGSPDHKVSDLFGLADRKNGNAESDLAVVACALQDALKRIAQLEARA